MKVGSWQQKEEDLELQESQENWQTKVGARFVRGTGSMPSFWEIVQ